MPLLVAVPVPDEIATSPPAPAALEPPVTSRAPAPAEPSPATRETEPAVPPVAAPLCTATEPEEPELAEPDKKEAAPLTPVVPALADDNLRVPLEVETPDPDKMTVLPPVEEPPLPA